MIDGCSTNTKEKKKSYRNVVIELIIITFVCLYVSLHSPFFVAGKISLATGMMILYYVLNLLFFNRFNSVVFILIASVFICFTYISVIYLVPYKTEYYIPKSVIKNNSKVVLIGENIVLMDTTSIRIYNSKSVYICKDIRTDGFKRRVSDYWYICEKDKHYEK